MQMARDRVAIAGRIGSKSGLGGQVRRRARATDTAGRPVRRDPSRAVDSVVRSILGAIRLGCYCGAGALVNERGLALGLLLSVALKDDIWLSFAGLVLAGAFLQAAAPVLWTIPPMLFTPTVAGAARRAMVWTPC